MSIFLGGSLHNLSKKEIWLKKRFLSRGLVFWAELKTPQLPFPAIRTAHPTPPIRPVLLGFRGRFAIDCFSGLSLLWFGVDGRRFGFGFGGLVGCGFRLGSVGGFGSLCWGRLGWGGFGLWSASLTYLFGVFYVLL